ncbi:MAG: arginine--tRNA ligase [bacterium]|jgi:arginyl-tRNA synthetase
MKMSTAGNPLKDVRKQIAAAIGRSLPQVGNRPEGFIKLLPIEPPRKPGYSTTVCFDLASESLKDEFDALSEKVGKKEAKMALKERSAALAASFAQRICDEIAQNGTSLPCVAEIVREAGYVNFYFDVDCVSRCAIEASEENGLDFGKGAAKSERIMVEYSQPNTHKVFHVGHTRNAALGAAVANLLEFSGYEVIRANYIGDIGAHVIKCLWALLKFPGEFDHIEDESRRLGEYYSLADKVESGEEINTKSGPYAIEPELFDAEIKELFARWDSGDAELVRLWRDTRAASLKGFERIYTLLNAGFDHVFYESDVESEGKRCVQELLEMGIAEIGSEGDYAGAAYVDLDAKLPGSDLRKMVVLRADGSSLYQTKELALAKRKFGEFGIDRAIYVVASEQSFYFKQIFAILKLWGFPQAEKCVHLPYEIVTLAEGKMSSRSGTVVLFEDLLAEAMSKLAHIAREKGYSADAEDTALKVAIGAIKFSMLNIDHNKVLVFDWEQALNFNGQAAPYIQYMGVRAKRILAEAGDTSRRSAQPPPNLQVYDHELALAIGRFPDVVETSADQLAPYVLTRYCFELAQKFGEFYRFCPVLKANVELRDWRLREVEAFLRVLESGLRLLGIEIPEAM